MSVCKHGISLNNGFGETCPKCESIAFNIKAESEPSQEESLKHHFYAMAWDQGCQGIDSDAFVNDQMDKWRKNMTASQDEKSMGAGIQYELGSRLLDFLRDIHEQKETPESNDVDDLLVLFSQYIDEL